MNRRRLLSIVVAYVALHLAAACTPDQCTAIMQTPIVGEGLRALEKYLDGTIGVQGVGDAALCSANPNAPSPGSQPDAFNDHVQNCSQCLTDSCTRELDACEKDAICDGIANGRLPTSAANAVWQATVACVSQCVTPCTVSTSSSSGASSSASASSSSGTGQGAGAS
jgi:hypothetical protein